MESLEEVHFTHEELLEVTRTALDELLQVDSFLSDLPKGVTLEEVNSQIALLHGRSITVFVARGDGETMPVVVPQATGTVSDLKKGIKRYINLKLSRNSKNTRKKLLSWKYIWKTYNLQHEDLVLTDNSAKLSQYGIQNRSTVTFVKRKRNKMTNRR